MKALLFASFLWLLTQNSGAFAGVFESDGAVSPGKYLTVGKVPKFNPKSVKSLNVKVKSKKMKIKEIPELSVGLPATIHFHPAIKKEDFKVEPAYVIQNKFPSKDIDAKTWKATVSNAPTVATLGQALKLAASENLPLLPEVVMNPRPATDPKAELVQILTPEDIKWFQALIFSQVHKNHELALGLYAELKQSKEYVRSATLFFGTTAGKLGLRLTGIEDLLKIIHQDQKDLTPKALEFLAEMIQTTDREIAENSAEYFHKYKINENLLGKFHLAMAKYLMDQKAITDAKEELKNISDIDLIKPEAEFLEGLAYYRTNHITEAISSLSKLIAKLNKGPTYRWDLKSLAAMTLARLYFQQNKYKEAFDLYVMVDKGHPLWIQSVVESAWSQILVKDYEGGAGNMFSLHTDYFKNAYQPETYIVRTVSYLNLCQFGDAQNVLDAFIRKYQYAQGRIQDYIKTHKTETYYDTVRKFLTDPSQKEIDNLPRSLIVEMARFPDFLQEQKRINEVEDEKQKFNTVALQTVARAKEYSKNLAVTRTHLQETEAKLRITKGDPEIKVLQEELQRLKSRRIRFEIQFDIASRADTSLAVAKKESFQKLDVLKNQVRKKASENLKARFDIISKDLEHWLDQSQILQYEIYSGAGEHIRYQMAGGETKKEAHPELKLSDEKSQKWGFHGEIWEDEVGHYRSSLKNVCPKEEEQQQEKH